MIDEIILKSKNETLDSDLYMQMSKSKEENSSNYGNKQIRNQNEEIGMYRVR